MATDVGGARVEIVGDVARFARRAERELNKALRDLKLRPVRIDLDLDHARDQVRFLADDIQEAITDIDFSDMSDRAAEAVRDIEDEFGDIDFTRMRNEARAAVRDLGDSFKREGRRSGDGFTSELISAGVRAAKLFAGSLTSGLSLLPSLIKPTLITALVASFAGALAVAGPILGGLLASAILLGVAGVGIGLAAVLLKEEPAVVNAAKRFVDRITGTFRNAARPMIAPLVEALDIFGDTAERIGPRVRAMFASFAPAVAPFARAIAGLVENAIPGFEELVRASAPFLTGIAPAIERLGFAFDKFFASIAAAGPSATIFFNDFIDALGDFIVWLGRAIRWLSDAYVSLKNFFAALREPGAFDNIVSGIQGLIETGFQYLVANLPRIIDAILAAKQAVFDAVIELIGVIAQALPTLVPQLVQAVVSMVTTLVTTLATNRGRFAARVVTSVVTMETTARTS